MAQAPAEAAPKPEWKEAFAQGPFQLGTPLNLFRSMRNPDDKAAFPVCSENLSTEAWQSKTGAKFENKVATWKNSVSQIELKQLGLSRDFFSLRCTLSPLMAVLNSRLDAPSADQAKKP